MPISPVLPERVRSHCTNEDTRLRRDSVPKLDCDDALFLFLPITQTNLISRVLRLGSPGHLHHTKSRS